MGELSIIGYSWLGAIFSIKNKMNDMIYVGKSATSFDRRWNIHKSDLKIGKHSNKNLQNDWNIYGEDAFIFSIVEEKKDDINLNDLEKKWLYKYPPERLYNFTHSILLMRQEGIIEQYISGRILWSIY